MKRLYEITKGVHEWQCRVEVDEEFIIANLSTDGKPYTTKDAIKEMVEFWSGWEIILASNKGDYTKTFLQNLAMAVYTDLVEYSWNVEGVISQFENRAGWFKMDGSNGILITFTDDVEIEHSEFYVEEVKP